MTIVHERSNVRESYSSTHETEMRRSFERSNTCMKGVQMQSGERMRVLMSNLQMGMCANANTGERANAHTSKHANARTSNTTPAEPHYGPTHPLTAPALPQK